jgi:tryptophan-rich hypothetical protein
VSLPANRISPKKLGLSKWTAAKPVGKDKHFLVVKVMKPVPPQVAIDWVELEAVFSKTVTRMDWRDLRDAAVWRRGWV